MSDKKNEHFLELTADTQYTVNQSDLVHMLYDAVADNSLWPEMISELIEHIELAAQANENDTSRMSSGLVAHFQRALRLSEKFVSLQEENTTLNGMLNSLAFGFSLFDRSGNLIYANEMAQTVLPKLIDIKAAQRQIAQKPHSNGELWSDLNSDVLGDPQKSQVVLQRIQEGNTEIAVIPVSSINNNHLPANAETIVLTMPQNMENTINHVASIYYLTNAETQLLSALYMTKNLRMASEECNVSYESGRTYLKRIFTKTGQTDQLSLLSLIDRNPISLIEQISKTDAAENPVRQTLTLPDGRTFEFFQLGPKDGHAILHFDALTGVTIDILGAPHIYEPVFKKLGLQLIVPCRPGTFRSDFKRLDGLAGLTSDILYMLQKRGIEKTTLLSQAFGSCAALAFAATAPDYVRRVVLCAPSYPRHEPDDWRTMDLFYIISGVIGRRAPALLKVIVPFLMRSVMQNTSKYLERHVSRSKCQADIDVLRSPMLQKRIPEMLAARTVNGTDGLVQENFLNTHGWDFDLKNITMPVNIIQGELDNVSHPDGSRKLAAALPNATYHSFPELGQYLLFSQWPSIFELCAQEPNHKDEVSSLSLVDIA